ncbi:MAG: DEAD/DEAH box helicase, partial [Ilumatobacteraceae bacterium]
MIDHDISGHHEEAPETAADDGFDTLGLRPELLKTIVDLGYEEPTPIQRETIPHLLAGRDLLGQAATGTGKTAAFALPVLQMIDTGAKVVPFALILVPTRELAMQVSEAIFRYGRGLNVKVTPIYGGQPIYRQLQALDRGVHIVVATPGRALDHIGRGSLHLGAIRTVILDEA